MAVQLRLQLLHAIAVMRRHFQHRIAQLAINAEQRVQCWSVLLVNQISLVEQQQGTNPGMLSGHQVAVNQVGVRFGHGRKHNHDHVDVGGNRLELAATVRTAQFGFTRQLSHDNADALVASAPHHRITGYQCRQIGAQVATEHLAFKLTFLCFDFDLHTKVRDHQTELFGA